MNLRDLKDNSGVHKLYINIENQRQKIYNNTKISHFNNMKKSLRKKIVSALTILLSLFIPVFVFSQSQTPADSTGFGETPEEIRASIETMKKELGKIGTQEVAENSANVSIFPRYPKPREKVLVRVYSSFIDLNSAEVSLYLDKKLIEKRTGATKFEFTTKNSGETTRLGIIIKSTDGITVEKIVNITPIDIDILWEADTYTPPFYKGKALLSPNSPVKIVAMPKIKLASDKIIDHKNLIYLWGGSFGNFKDSSGYGRNVLYTDSPTPFRENEITVTVSTTDGEIESQDKFKMNMVNPSILFYEDHPTEGVRYGSAIKNNFNLKNKEIVIKAEPYFFASADKNDGSLEYIWTLNGKEVAGNNEKITLRQDGAGGVARLNMDIKNIARNFQSARNSFNLNFGGSDGIVF